MNRRKFITNTGLSFVAICLAPSLLNCSGKGGINFENLLGQPISVLLESSFVSKEGNEDFGYYFFDKEGFVNNLFPATKAFVFYKKSEIIGFTLIIEGINEINKLTKEISSLNGKHKLNYENDFGKEFEWVMSDKNVKLSYNDYKGLPELTFYSEFLMKDASFV